MGSCVGTRGCLAAAVTVAALITGAPARATVSVLGIDPVLTANSYAHLRLDEEPCDAPRWRVEQLQQAAPARIREALEAYGYYEPRIESTLEFTDECWQSTFTVAAGEPTRIRTLRLEIDGEAAEDPAFARTAVPTTLEIGTILDHGAYESLKRRWSDIALERGYAEARFVESRIDVYPAARVADVALIFDSGPRYSFGETVFRQNVLTDRLVRSYVSFQAGEPYDARRLTEVYVAFADSGYFRNIDVRPLDADREQRVIPIEVTLTPASRRQITYGVGFSTDTGPRLRFGRNNRRFNDRGHQFGVNAQLSPVVSEVTANYRLPLGGSQTEWLSFDSGIEREDTETSESESLELSARRVLERPGAWTRSQIVTLRIEDFEVAGQVGRSRLLMPGVDWTRVRADNTIRPRRGSRLSLETRAASDVLGSDTSFVQTIAQGKWIWSLREARVLVRGHVGVTLKRAFDELPPSVRFFAGGDNSVRGYDFEALGPLDAEGKVIGGSKLATGSFEFEQPLRARWSLAFFVDAGNAFEGSRPDAKTGAGLGGRWQSPLGPIRVDLAHPLDDPTDDWRLHISLGPDL